MAPRNNRVNPETQTRGAARSFVSVLDGYYRPQAPTGPDTRKQEAFQRGLAQLSGIAETEAQSAQKERREGYFNQGVLDEAREQAGQELKGVKQGNILRQNSKFYQMGLNESRGKSAAIKWKNDLQVEFEQSGIDQQKDPEAFRAWMNQKTSEFLQQFEGNDFALAGAMPTVTEVNNNLASTYSGRLNETLKKESFDAFSTEVMDIFETGLYSGRSEEDIINELSEITDDFYNLEGGVANDTMVQSVIDYANMTNDVAPLGILAKAVDAGKIKLNPSQLAAIGDAADAVEIDIQNKQTRRDKFERRKVDELTRNATASYLDQMMNDPEFDLQTWFIESGTAEAAGEYKSEVFRNLLTTQNAYIAAEEASADQRNALSKEQMFYNFDVEFHSVPLEEKPEVIARYAGTGALTASQVASYNDTIRKMADPTSIMNTDFMKKKREGFLDPLKGMAEGGIVDINKATEMTILGEKYYNEYLLNAGSGVDPTDFAAQQELHQQAVEYANSALADDFGQEFVQKVLDEPQLARESGAGAEVAQRQQAFAEEQARLAQEAATQTLIDDSATAIETAGMEQENPEQPQEPQEPQGGLLNSISNFFGGGEQQQTNEGVEVTAGPAPEELPDEPPQVPSEPLIEGALETDPEQLAAKPDTFYEEIMNRLTDGEDTRTSVSPSALVETGKRILGLDENSQAAAISNYLADGGVNLDPRTTAWCAGYVNATLAQNGMDGTGRLNARSFMNWGQQVDRPQVGDVVVLWRDNPDSWKGHVGFFKGFDENGNVLILGGNQGNKVSVAAYPSNRVLGFRRPPGVTTGGETQMAGSINQLATQPTDFLPEGAYDQD